MNESILVLKPGQVIVSSSGWSILEDFGGCPEPALAQRSIGGGDGIVLRFPISLLFVENRFCVVFIDCVDA